LPTDIARRPTLLLGVHEGYGHDHRFGITEHLDEVTSALDPGLVAEVLNVIRELAEMGMTMIIASHEMSFVRDTAHRVCFLDSGVILEEGLPETMFRAPDYPRTKEFLQRIIEAGRP
jgi:polar amino acid transport system ATP-binding protein